MEKLTEREEKKGTLSFEKYKKWEDKFYNKSKKRYYPHVGTHPYVPSKWDYSFEFGSIKIDESNQYWLGFDVGRHISTCIFSSSQSCQQFIDFHIASSGTNFENNTYIFPGLRWQFVNFPSPWSQVVRLFTGVMLSSQDEGNSEDLFYGIGYGFTRHLHKRANIRFEIRGGNGREPFVQAFVALELKVDQWLAYFANKAGSLGESTFDYGGKAIRAVKKPFSKENKEARE